jgi:hypothetical protein
LDLREVSEIIEFSRCHRKFIGFRRPVSTKLLPFE